MYNSFFTPSPLLLPHAPPSICLQQEDERVTAEFRRKWVELQKILDRQREKGGVIDPEAESNRFLIHINDVSCRKASHSVPLLHTFLPFLATPQTDTRFRVRLPVENICVHLKTLQTLLRICKLLFVIKITITNIITRATSIPL